MSQGFLLFMYLFISISAVELKLCLTLMWKPCFHVICKVDGQYFLTSAVFFFFVFLVNYSHLQIKHIHHYFNVQRLLV